MSNYVPPSADDVLSLRLRPRDQLWWTTLTFWIFAVSGLLAIMLSVIAGMDVENPIAIDGAWLLGVAALAWWRMTILAKRLGILTLLDE